MYSNYMHGTLTKHTTLHITDWFNCERVNLLHSYAEFEIFRSRIVAENTWTAADAREQLSFRNFTCYYEQCSPCISSCTVQWIKTVANIVKCTIGNRWFSTTSCRYQSDAGQRILATHGAVREKNLKGNVRSVLNLACLVSV